MRAAVAGQGNGCFIYIDVGLFLFVSDKLLLKTT